MVNYMKYNVGNIECNVEIIRKNNKNTYIKVKGNNIIVTTNYFVTKGQIIKLLDENINFLYKNLKREENKKDRNENFYFFGKKYDIIITPLYDVFIENNKIYTKSLDVLNKWLNKEVKKIYLSRLDYYYNLFDEKIPYPNLRVRKMTTRWGVCNRKTNTVTLNLELYKYEDKALDYVIVHELCHFIHFNHSKEFWSVVEKYFPNYKKVRQYLKD